MENLPVVVSINAAIRRRWSVAGSPLFFFSVGLGIDNQEWENSCWKGADDERKDGREEDWDTVDGQKQKIGQDRFGTEIKAVLGRREKGKKKRHKRRWV